MTDDMFFWISLLIYKRQRYKSLRGSVCAYSNADNSTLPYMKLDEIKHFLKCIDTNKNTANTFGESV